MHMMGVGLPEENPVRRWCEVVATCVSQEITTHDIMGTLAEVDRRGALRPHAFITVGPIASNSSAIGQSSSMPLQNRGRQSRGQL